MTALHSPIRPQWICVGCGYAWPCPTRRGQLAAEYDRAPVCLSLLMSAHFVQAAADLPGVPAGDLRMRFVVWLPGTR
ncbi:flavin reductase [Planosporangium sp. 12N6]|uniref:flavin reductase n=1 Tax=Planosporangium spinosum TaxID=3402278 RepID=UPI003CF60A9F